MATIPTWVAWLFFGAQLVSAAVYMLLLAADAYPLQKPDVESWQGVVRVLGGVGVAVFWWGALHGWYA